MFDTAALALTLVSELVLVSASKTVYWYVHTYTATVNAYNRITVHMYNVGSK